MEFTSELAIKNFPHQFEIALYFFWVDGRTDEGRGRGRIRLVAKTSITFLDNFGNLGINKKCEGGLNAFVNKRIKKPKLD